MSTFVYTHVPVARTRLRRHENILRRILWRRYARRFTSIVYDLLRGPELVRHVGPQHRPLRRHEFEKPSYFPPRLF
jgi:hypothetical protein